MKGATGVKKPKAWKRLQEEVATLYRDLGAVRVVEDMNIDGHQIDVYVEMPHCNGSILREVVSCKDYSRPAGAPAVREWNAVFQALSAEKRDIATIVSTHGFTQDAHPAASACGVKLVTLDQLRWASCDFTPYLRALSSEFRKLPVFAEKRYIPLRLCEDGSTKVLDAEDGVAHFLEKSLSPLLTILGDFGAGKTTLCRHLFLTLAERFLAKPMSVRVPLYVNLRD
jgi:hypothetical protein